MKRRKKATRSGLESIQDELVTISADVASLGNTLGEVASVEARDMINSIRARLDRIARDARIAARAGVGMMQDTIEENPVICVAVAFGLGVVLASMRRREQKAELDQAERVGKSKSRGEDPALAG